MDEIAIVKKQVQKAEWAERIVPVKPSCVHKNQSPPLIDFGGGLCFYGRGGFDGYCYLVIMPKQFAI